MINIEAVKRVLESQGKLDFKPFHFDNANQDYWAYRTNDNHFYVCNNDLMTVYRSQIGVEKPWYFVLNTEQDYRLLNEGESVSAIQDQQPNNIVKSVWLIKEYMEGTEFVELNIDGYKSIADEWIIFETQTIDIKPNEESYYWVPNKKVACYKSWDFLEESDRFYCGTYNDSDLFFSEGCFFMEYRHPYGRESRWHYFEKLVVWFCKGGISLVDISHKKGSFIVGLYEHAVRMEEPYGWDYIGDKCIGSHIINKAFNLSEINFFADDNVFVLSNYSPRTSSWITIDRYGNLGSVETEIEGKIVSLCNDILRIDTSPRGEQGKLFELYDYKGNCLTRVTDKDTYTIITKSLETAISVDEYKESNLFTLKGVINTNSHSLVVPVRYKYLELFTVGDSFYAIIGEEYTDTSGAKAIQYGLLYNDALLLPCNNVEIKLLSENLFVWRNGDKFGLVSNGKVCCDNIYSKISVASSEGASRELEHYSYLGAVYKYRQYKYAYIDDGDKSGVFVPDWDMFIPPRYKDITAFVEEHFVLADGILYSTIDGNLTYVKDVTNYDYIGALCCYHLFREKESSKNRINSYICVHLKDGKLSEEDVIDAKYDHNIEDDWKSDIDWRNYSPILSMGCSSVFYSVKEKCFEDDINFFSSCSEPYIDPDEGYNYERDTYYALGGDDYDQWKENGGDLDGMMEGMGF